MEFCEGGVESGLYITAGGISQFREVGLLWAGDSIDGNYRVITVI